MRDDVRVQGLSPAERDLSPAAELFVTAIDPATGRLVKRKRRRFRKALAASPTAAAPASAARARRAAIEELLSLGLIEKSRRPGRYPVVVGSTFSAPLSRVRRAIVRGNFDEPRDVRLFALLAWTGVLAQRLDRSERRSAARQIKKLLAPPPASHSELEPISPIAHALGQVAYREQIDFVQEVLGDFTSGNSISVDFGGGFSGGASDSGGDGGSD